MLKYLYVLAKDDKVGALWGAPALTHSGSYVFLTKFRTIQWKETKFSNITTVAMGSPLLLDLDKNGFHLGPKEDLVLFDILAAGDHSTKYQWVSKGTGDAFLYRDLNGNNTVDDGAELFGEGTELELTGIKAINGFEALAQYDLIELGGNADGMVTNKDDIWSSLKLWVDTDADGISSVGELKTLTDNNIVSLNIRPKTHSSNRRDGAGNLIPFWSWVIVNNGAGSKFMKMADVFFIAGE